MSLVNLAIPIAVLLATGGDPSPQIGIPSIANSSVPTLISLVGTEAGGPDRARGEFTVVVRSVANNPWADASVVVDLTGCQDLAICADQHEPFPATLVNCIAKTVRKFTGVDGRVTFTICGGGSGSGAVSLIGSGRVYANGVFLGAPTVAAYDLDGVAGLGANDLSTWLRIFGSTANAGSGDYDGNGSVGINDLAMWLVAYGDGHQIESCSTICP